MESFSTDLLLKLSKDLVNIDVQDLIVSCSSIDNIPDKTDRYKQLSNICMDNGIIHPEWLNLAGRIAAQSLKDSVPQTFSKSTEELSYVLDANYVDFVKNNAEVLDNMIVHERDWIFTIFGIETLLKSYLARLKIGNTTKMMETPQYLYMRVSCHMWMPNLEKIKETYDELSKGIYTHASPTMFNSGMIKPQCASCFVTTITDNMDGIAKGWKDIAIMSKHSGGWGIDVTQLRHSEIGQYGVSKGIIGWIQIIDKILSIVDQGGKRKGSGTFWLQIYHIDSEEYIDLKKVTGSDAMRARDSFYGIVIPDLFMRRVKKDENWTLFCPNKAKHLAEAWGIQFEMLYTNYENEAKLGNLKEHRVVKARDLWKKIIMSQIETGGPFMLYKDAANRKSNQMNIGTIRQSNLCCEIMLATGKVKRSKDVTLDRIIHSDLAEIFKKHDLKQSAQDELMNYFEKDEKNKDTYESIASCNLASIALNKFVMKKEDSSLYYNFELLEKYSSRLVENLNQVVDRNYYPNIVPEIKECNFTNRPLGIGVQGLADVFAMLDIAWESPEAILLNKQIFETLYYGAVKKSVELAKLYGPYSNFDGSPSSKGFFQFDLWDNEEYMDKFNTKMEEKSSDITHEWLSDNLPDLSQSQEVLSGRHDWENLRKDMVKYGLRNSTLIALMPTASSANVLGNNECFEPITMNLYARTVLSGQFIILNKHMVDDFNEIGLWNTRIVQGLLQSQGSVQNIEIDPTDYTDYTDNTYKRLVFLKKKYKTVFEIPQSVLLQLMIDRSRWVDQTQSFNCWMADPKFAELTAFHFKAWEGGAKTGMYYLRRKALSDPLNFSIDTISIPDKKSKRKFVCVGENGCIGCES